MEEVIKGRRATYTNQFSGEAITKSEVEHLLEMANWAPSHKRTEPWRFQVFMGAAKERLFDALELAIDPALPGAKLKMDKNKQKRKNVGSVIAIILNRTGLVPEIEEVCAVACSVQNLWLSLSHLDNVGGYWSTPAFMSSNEFERFLELESNQACLGLFYLGRKKSQKNEVKGARKPWVEKVQWHHE